MATEYRVECSKKDGPDDDRRIDGIGGTIGGGWFLWSREAIDHIKSGTSAFYTYENGYRADVLVRRHLWSGQDYLTTSPDGVQANNLLRLRDCDR